MVAELLSEQQRKMAFAQNPDIQFPTKDALKEWYVNEGKTQKEIGEICNCSGRVVGKWLRRHGIDRPSRTVTVESAWCGTEKVVALSRYKNNSSGNFFCDFDCLGKWRKKHIGGENHPLFQGGKMTVKCSYCGNEKKVWPANNREYEYHFCQPECQSKFYSLHFTGEKSPGWRGGRAKRKIKCDYCGTVLYRCQAKIDSYNKHFCNRKCHSQWQSENKTLENSPGWRGGVSFEPYPVGWNRRFKAMIRERYNHRCQLCGVTQAEYSRKLDVHHIDYDKDNLHPTNLIPLCQSCHGKTTGNRDVWQSLFAPLAIHNDPSLHSDIPRH